MRRGRDVAHYVRVERVWKQKDLNFGTTPHTPTPHTPQLTHTHGHKQGKVSQFKLVLLGEAAVGKSSIVLRFVKNEFQEFQESTIGAAFCTKTLTVEETGTTIKYEVWDTAGQERYASLAPMYYRGAHAAVVVYSIASADSYAKAQKWVRDLNGQANPGIIICLVGNKTDLEASREVATDDAQAYAEEHSLLFVETSAKSGDRVLDIFQEIAKALPTSPAASAGQRPASGVVTGLEEEGSGQEGGKKGCGCVVM